ncbi:MAG: RNA methyltransferase, partial [Bacteroidia bacterium]|nr:RNA methyltransferase [Bacteroidia bacterium]
TEEEYLLCRIGEKAYEKALEKDNVIPMDFTGRSMKGYIFVVGEGIKSKKDLSYWLQLCLNFNPLAKASKK